jgi:hypothetical protein
MLGVKKISSPNIKQLLLYLLGKWYVILDDGILCAIMETQEVTLCTCVNACRHGRGEFQTSLPGLSRIYIFAPNCTIAYMTYNYHQGQNQGSNPFNDI